MSFIYVREAALNYWAGYAAGALILEGAGRLAKYKGLKESPFPFLQDASASHFPKQLALSLAVIGVANLIFSSFRHPLFTDILREKKLKEKNKYSRIANETFSFQIKTTVAKILALSLSILVFLNANKLNKAHYLMWGCTATFLFKQSTEYLASKWLEATFKKD